MAVTVPPLEPPPPLFNAANEVVVAGDAGAATAEPDVPPIANGSALARLTEAGGAVAVVAEVATAPGSALDDRTVDAAGAVAGARAGIGVVVGRELGVAVLPGVGVLACVIATATAHSVVG
jgi:hypothetical protein